MTREKVRRAAYTLEYKLEAVRGSVEKRRMMDRLRDTNFRGKVTFPTLKWRE